MLKKIVAIGPESTGKSTLCEQLAEHYNALWCPEFARKYLAVHGTKYTYDDLLTIAKGQADLEDSIGQAAALNAEFAAHDLPFFIDTNMHVMKVWCEFVFGRCHQFILDQIQERKYDLYLLCNIDLPWVHDELREYPDIERRKELYNIYQDILLNQTIPWVEISGSSEQRLKKAVDQVDRLINQ